VIVYAICGRECRTREGIIAALVRYNHAHRARSVGLTNAQVRMAALAFNLKRWHVLTLASRPGALPCLSPATWTAATG
jgi:hypothetical protein